MRIVGDLRPLLLIAGCGLAGCGLAPGGPETDLDPMTTASITPVRPATPAPPARTVVEAVAPSDWEHIRLTASTFMPGSAKGEIIDWTNPDTGSNGTMSPLAAARNEPDGRSMVLVTSVNAVSPFLYKHMGYDPVKDLAPIARWVTTAYFMVVPTSLPVHSVQELVAYAKAHPGRLNYGSQGIGSPAHLAGELLSLQAGIKAVHVPFKGGPEVMSSMMSGDVQLSFAPIPNALPLVRAGKLRVLGVTSRERFALTPDIPTVAEQGYPDFEVVSFYGAMAPAGTPAAIRERISDEMRQALAMPEVKRKLAEQGLEAAWLSPEDFGKYFQEEMHKYGELTRRAKIEKQ